MLNPSLSKTKKSYDWINELNSDWSSALFDSISFEYSSSLNTFIEQIYLSGKEIYPQKDKLFVPFKKCSLKDVKIVIIDNRPVKDLRSSGIGRGIEEKSSLISDLPIELREFRDCIYETVYGNQYSITNFDNSLDEYCDNDMLFLNCSVCVEKDKDYKIIWKHFIRDSNRLFDFGNATEIIFDLLTAHDIIPDDNISFIFPSIMTVDGILPNEENIRELKWYSVNKENPGVWIKII
jgi:uracil DNA glycosylase